MQRYIKKEHRIFIAGHKGMAGSAIKRALINSGYNNLLTVDRNNLDLEDQYEVKKWMNVNKPDVVIIAAAKVGGIIANNNLSADFILKNLNIQTNLIKSSFENDVKRLLFLGSSCIYPKLSKQPIREEYLLTSSLEKTDQWYAIAKIAGLKLCQALRKQYGFDAISLMPTNLYGPGDNYHPTQSHVLPSFIRKFTEAAFKKNDTISCWGSGSPKREFLHVDDLGEATVFALENFDPNKSDLLVDEDGEIINYLNVGTGIDLTIKELSEKVALFTGYEGEIIWDKSKPDGTPQKKLDISRIRKLGWEPKIDINTGIKSTINIYKSHNHNESNKYS